MLLYYSTNWLFNLINIVIIVDVPTETDLNKQFIYKVEQEPVIYKLSIFIKYAEKFLLTEDVTK